MAADLVLQGGLETLGAKGLGVDGCSKLDCRVAGCRQPECKQGRLGDEFHSVGKFVVKVSQRYPCTAVPKLLVDASIVSAGSFWTNGRDAILLDQIAAVRQCVQNVKERYALVINAWFFDALTKAE